jgi:hypothetical protein
MTRLFLFLFLCSTLNYSFSQTIIWEDEIVVGTAADYGIVRPRIALGKDNVPVVIMTRIQNGQVYFAKKDNGAFTTPISLLPNSMQSYIANWTGPDMEAKGDTIVVVFKAKPYDNGPIYSVRSIDGGSTFSDTIRTDNHPIGLAWMPSMDMDATGNPIVTYMAHDSNYTNPTYVYVRSLDAGLSYQNEQIITTNVAGEACDCCPAELVSKGNKQVLLYRNNEVNIRDIYGVYSNDAGNSFNSEDDLDESNWLINSCPSSGPHGAITDTILYTTFMSGATGSEKIYISKSIVNDSISFVEKQMIIPTTTISQNYPRIATFSNLTLIAWTESVSNNYEIFTAYSLNGDLSQMQTTKQIANQTTNGIQTNPDIRIENGNIHLVYQDNGNGKVIYRTGKLGYTGIAEQQKKTEILYPNPIVAGEIIQLPNAFKSSQIEWLDMAGKIVHISTQTNQTTCIVPQLEKGTYLLQNENHTSVYRVQIF